MTTETLKSVPKTGNGTGSEQTRAGATFLPNVDILETPQELQLVADIPGARSDGIDVDFEKGTLTIRAKVEPRLPKNGFLLREYGVGDYQRTFQVSEKIDASRITAQLQNGVLTLHLPKIDAVQPRKIQVATG